MLESNQEYKLRLKTLGEIGKFTRGNGIAKSDLKLNGKPVIHYGQIHTTYNIRTDKTFSFVDDQIYSKLRKANFNDLLIVTASENQSDLGKSIVWTGKNEIGISDYVYAYKTKENSKYIQYWTQTNYFKEQKNKNMRGSSIYYLLQENMEKFKILIPPLELQNKIVAILDKFQDAIEHSKGLLPQEIELRKAQYEYYRDKLLSFDIDVTPERERESKIQ
ncbi:restriction endonuclease subunit S [Mesomycoplasma lagogenitalium]|uniref:Restriction endonuclease subunit S n=1 Tax=Mesomycoplasma lagogenitalium TaxID=171286 RepID=A0ABY8LWL3_9BACT|nr:restriction endonuclease subunit S [Mesomycoplasma lagogenitalium]WGI36693.1 restriction endonuclease subunit S [Mesomycoplasma lagogenitalium]